MNIETTLEQMPCNEWFKLLTTVSITFPKTRLNINVYPNTIGKLLKKDSLYLRVVLYGTWRKHRAVISTRLRDSRVLWIDPCKICLDTLITANYPYYQICTCGV